LVLKKINLNEVKNFEVDPERLFFSASAEEIKSGLTSDIYFIRTNEVLEKMGLSKTPVVAEIFPRKRGMMAGVPEVINLLQDSGVNLWSLPEGAFFEPNEIVMRLEGPYEDFGFYETAILGILASSSGWATNANLIKEACGEHPFYCFGARHVHPAVAPAMERAAMIGGAAGASCILAAKHLNREPTGTLPHAIFLIVGDTVEVAKAYHAYMPPDAPRLILVDTFKDEAEETLRVAQALGNDLAGVRLDTPSERGGVTPDLVREVRARLDQAGFRHVKIFVSGGLTPEKIIKLVEAGADSFGVGSFISGAPPIDMTMDIKEVNKKPLAKRGRIPGITPNPRLVFMKSKKINES